jgi:hypothetical protein
LIFSSSSGTSRVGCCALNIARGAPLAIGELDISALESGFGRHHALRGIGVAGRIAAYCARAQRGSEKVQVGTPSFRIFSAFSGSFSCCH